MSHYPLVLPVKVFLGLINFRARSKNGCAVLYFADASVRFYCGNKISYITCSLGDNGIMVNMNQRMIVYLFYKTGQISLNIIAFKSAVDLPRHAAELTFFFHKVNFMSLFRYGEKEGQL